MKLLLLPPLAGLKRLLPTAAAAVAISACISDGPNITGKDYVASQGIRLSTPLHRVVLADFPVEEVRPQELELNHFGESLLVVGREGPYRATARLGFRIEDQKLRDSLGKGLRLKMSALWEKIPGFAYLHRATQGRDSLTLVVESFAWKDSTGKQLRDTLAKYHVRVLSSPQPFSLLPSTGRRRDTVRIALAAAYDTVDTKRDSLQAVPLPRLQAALRTDTTKNWLVYLEISPAGPDSGLFRFVGNESSNAYGTGLLLGSRVDSLEKRAALRPYPSGQFALPAVNYRVEHSGDTETLLYGVSRGMHLRLNRDTLMRRIADSLGSRFPSGSPEGKYDVRFFVPHAEIRLPLRDSLARVEGPFALDMQMFSDVDSVDPKAVSGLTPVALDDTLTLYPADASGGGSGPADTLTASYRKHPLDTALRQLIFQWKKSSNITDTFILVPDQKSRELGLRRYSGLHRAAAFRVVPDPDMAWLEIFFSAGGANEARFFLDTAGKDITDPAGLKRRYWIPGSGQLIVRATHGMTALLNRLPDSRIAPDFFLIPSDRNAFDTAGFARIPYPVLGEIGFPREGGSLRVTLDLFLFPLRSPP